MSAYKWCEKYVPDADSSIALMQLGMPKEGSEFVWVDNRVLLPNGKMSLHLVRREDVDDRSNIISAYTTDEFQMILPLNFVPMQMRPGVWCIIDFYGTLIHEDKENKAAARQIVMSRVEGSTANRPAQAFAQAALFLLSTGKLSFK